MTRSPARTRRLRPLWRWLAVVALAAGLGFAPGVQAAEALPQELVGVTVVEHLGDRVDPNLRFTDEQGVERSMGELLQGDVPVLLTLNYYSCQTLCSLQLNALMGGLKGLDWTPGDRFRIITVSIDPKEGPELAREKRASYLEAYGRGDVDWRFLTGQPDQIEALASTIGFGYRFDERTGQYAHPAVLTFLSPDGVVARYVYGLEYSPRDLRFALMEAAAGRLGSPVDKLVLSCFRYDETEGRYTPFAFGVMRLGGVMTMVAMAGLGIVLWRREQTRPDRSDT